MALLQKKDSKEIGQEERKLERAIPAPKQPEIIRAPEKAKIPVEISPELPAESGLETTPSKPTERTDISPPTLSPAPSAPHTPALPKDELTKEIEEILSEDLTDLFLKMTPEQQEEFRVKGEETASKIRVLLSSAKVNFIKILSLIGEWLKTIPGISRFFLEQEAKIKTDKILLAVNKSRHQEEKK